MLERVRYSGMVMLATLALSSALVFPSPLPQEKEASYWYELMEREVQEALQRPRNEGKAKNIILFLGDGMGVTVATAGRILKGQKEGVSGEEGYLVWERFPNIALLKTYNLDKQVPDSAATATAYLAGVKANYETLGVSGKVKMKDCDASLLQENRLDSILQWAQDAGKDTGVVTTTQVTHATPAALYAKAAYRYWQCDTRMIDDNATHCKDIARQLVEDEPGRNMKVIMGGGRQEMGASLQKDTSQKCPRTDGRNLVQEWMQDKKMRGATHAYVTSTSQLRNVPIQDTDYLFGLFGDIHTPYEVDRDGGLDGTPSLKEMVLTAITILQKSPQGFFLLVEGGMIDRGMHNSNPRRALEELVQLEKAMEEALKVVDLEDTLVVVTADHSHTMTMAGYPPRGNDIFGVVKNRYVTDGLPYTTLMFATGPGYNYTWDGHKVTRPNLTGVDTGHKDYVSLAAVPTVDNKETHGGEDVAVFATGPMSHLFHRVHEQTFVAHVMAFSACIGPYKDTCTRLLKESAKDVVIHGPEGNTKNGCRCDSNIGNGHGHNHSHSSHGSQLGMADENQTHTSSDNQLGKDRGHAKSFHQVNKEGDPEMHTEQEDVDVDFASRTSNVHTKHLNKHKLNGGSSRLAPSYTALFLLALLGLNCRLLLRFNSL
ncbi:alkaline phosphatase [Procambarus clarkii]|uniref:alkaline phosphatase n=1 Tax=Procambarus clarkii TaxID=6728 RepID=UPI00374409F1